MVPVILYVGDRRSGRGELGQLRRVEHRKLGVVHALCALVSELDGLGVNLQQGRTRVPQRVEGAALYERLYRTLVVGLAVHALAQVEEVLERSILFPGGHDLLDEVAPDILYRREPE